MQLLSLLSGSPFGSEYSTIQRKLFNTFSAEKQKRIAQATDSVHYMGIHQIETTKNLEALFASILKRNPSKFYILAIQKVKRILPIRLTLMDGYWYCIAIDIEKRKENLSLRLYRGYWNRIGLSVPLSEEETEKILTTQEKEYRDIPFRVRLSGKGKEYFLRNSFPNMRLEAKENDILLVGEFNNNELPFLPIIFSGLVNMRKY